jgi:hypothetical protein
MALSLDLGTRNFSWVYIVEKNGAYGEFDLDFGLFSLDEDNMKSKVDTRCNKLIKFMKEKKEMYNIKIVVIEKQMRMNYPCQNLVYSLVTICHMLGLEYYLFSPIFKFTTIQQDYTTRGKKHKDLSICNARRFLSRYASDKLEQFLNYKKKDDIADALNQALIYGFINHYWLLDVEEYKRVVKFEE